MSMEVLGKSRNDVEVVVDLETSHATTHILAKPDLLDLAKDALADLDLDGEVVAVEKDLGRVVGTTDCVTTYETDEIVYAKRENRDNYTRFVKGRDSEPTNFVTMILYQKDDNYELWSAWIGRLAPKFPGDEREQPDSLEFWSNHALVWGCEPVQPGTETTISPW